MPATEQEFSIFELFVDDRFFSSGFDVTLELNEHLENGHPISSLKGIRLKLTELWSANKKASIGDLLATANFIISPRAYQAIEQCFLEDAQVFKVQIPKTIWPEGYGFYVRFLIHENCLLASRMIPNEEFEIGIDKLYFDPAIVKDRYFVRFDQPYRDVFFTSKFRDMVEGAGLIGFEFVEKWRSTDKPLTKREVASTVRRRKAERIAQIERNTAQPNPGVNARILKDEELEELAEAAATGLALLKIVCRKKRLPIKTVDLLNRHCMTAARAKKRISPKSRRAQAVALGALLGEYLVQEVNWRWQFVKHPESGEGFAVVSADAKYCMFPLSYMYDQLSTKDVNDINVKLAMEVIRSSERMPLAKPGAFLTIG